MANKTVYFLIDCSGSMYGNRADAVNTAMEKVVSEAIPEVRKQKSADLNLQFMVLGYSSCFTNNVVVIIDRTDLDDFTTWDRIENDMFNGGTPTGAALDEVIKDIQGGKRGEPDMNAVAPAIILVSDGMPNGTNPSYEEILQKAVKGDPNEVKNFRKALRVAIGMDVDSDGRDSLMKFGKVSRKMEQSGIKAYYDCSENYVDEFVEILKSVTVNASID